MSDKVIKICHLYPEVLNLYGDRGNILCLKKRLEWRGISADITEVKLGEKADLTKYDLFFIGGGQDFEQEVLLSDLKAGKGNEIKQAIGDEQDDYRAAVLNVRQSVRIIESSLEIQKDEEKGLKVIGAIYKIEDGTVEFGV